MSVKQNKILYIAVILLTFTYILSFTKSCSSKNKRETIKTALVNPKYKSQINRFIFSKDDEQLILEKNKQDKWIISDENLKIQLPASSEKIEKLLSNLTNITNMYKLSDKISKNSSFGLTDSSTFTIKYYFGDSFHQLYFGNQDFSLTSRYLMTDKNTTIYEISDFLDSYLSTNIQAWSDPYLISQEILGNIKSSDIQRTVISFDGKNSSIDDVTKFLDLRHGGMPSAENITSKSSEPVMTIKIELGNKNEIESKIYSTDEESLFVVINNYMNFNNPADKQIFTSKISLWTYNKIKEITL